jgi:hypothetical protein
MDAAETILIGRSYKIEASNRLGFEWIGGLREGFGGS